MGTPSSAESVPVAAAGDASADAGITIRGRRTRIASFAVAAVTGVYLFGSLADPSILQSGYPTLGRWTDPVILFGAAAALLAYFFVTGVSRVELLRTGIQVQSPIRRTTVPWDDLIRFHCDPAFAEMWLVYARSDRGGHRRPAWICVNERQGLAILADPRTAWIPTEGRFRHRFRAA